MEDEVEHKNDEQEEIPSESNPLEMEISNINMNKDLGQSKMEEVQEVFKEMNLEDDKKVEEEKAQIVKDPFEDILNNPENPNFQPMNMRPDQNVIMVNNQNFENNVMNKIEEHDQNIASLIYDNKMVNEEELEKPRFRQSIFSINEPPFARKISKLAENELPKASPFSSFANSIKASFMRMSEEEADRLMRIDEEHLELSNQDVILSKPGCVVKKCWKVKNLGTKQWPKDTRIVSVTEGLLCVPPPLPEFLNPGEMMEIGVNVYIPKTENGDNNIKEYILRLWCNELKCFGEPLIVTCHIDTVLFDETQENLSEEDKEFPRVATDGSFVENYEIAKELYQKRREPYAKTVYDLQKAEVYKH